MRQREVAFLDECRKAIREGWLLDDRKSPLDVVVTVVASQRSERAEDAYDFILSVGRKYPNAGVVVGSTSTVEKQAALAAQHMDLHLTVIDKAEKGDWDEGSTIRDERVVARCSQVVAFDTSSRSKAYAALAKRLNIQFHQL